ncbi:Hypothetical predicted protein [Paramuricea clavata]|uniref:Uncharacterized protein n=1 Tax=Paramuricea clavata TaxID=317549 RepID=A0A7D9LHV6_PARCT|nr:Hypothetical predicted protein [Paramuricea clavata]
MANADTDFGKACSFANAKRKELSEEVKPEYREEHAHIVPEIIEGKSKQSSASDVYALGRVVLKDHEYLIKWDGWPQECCSWEPSLEVIMDYLIVFMYFANLSI